MTVEECTTCYLSSSSAIVIGFSWQLFKLQIVLRGSSMSTLHLHFEEVLLSLPKEMCKSQGGAESSRPPRVENCETF